LGIKFAGYHYLRITRHSCMLLRKQPKRHPSPLILHSALAILSLPFTPSLVALSLRRLALQHVMPLRFIDGFLPLHLVLATDQMLHKTMHTTEPVSLNTTRTLLDMAEVLRCSMLVLLVTSELAKSSIYLATSVADMLMRCNLSRLASVQGA
jgi:hypothetical protein